MSLPCSVYTQPTQIQGLPRPLPAQVKPYVSAPSLGCHISPNMAKPQLFLQLTHPSPELLSQQKCLLFSQLLEAKPPNPSCHRLQPCFCL